MSSINAFRIVNARYNDGQNRIQDQTFHCWGRPTLLEMENGGGKTVMTQYLMGLFTAGSRRDIGKGERRRPFSSLFERGAPTFVLVEWNLDGGAGRLVTGMAVRKAAGQDSEGDSLDMLCFIGECGRDAACAFGIDAFPASERKDGAIAFKGWQDCRGMLEKFKEEEKSRFFVYDMGSEHASSQYFAKLSEYGIEKREWEGVIGKINSDEGALAELFKGCMNDRDLLDSWVLPLAEKKLSQGCDTVKRIREAFVDYAVQYGRQESDSVKKDALELYREGFGIFEAGARRVLGAGDALEATGLKLADAAQGILDLKRQIAAERECLGEQRGRLEAELGELDYQEQSVKLRRAEREMEKISREIASEEAHADRLRLEIGACRKDAAIQECRVLRSSRDKSRADLAGAEAELELAKNRARQKKEDLLDRRECLRGQMKGAFEAERDRLDARRGEQEEKHRGLKGEIAAGREELAGVRRTVLQLREAIGEKNGTCGEYAKAEARYAGRHRGEVFPGAMHMPLGYPRKFFEERRAALEGAVRTSAEALASAAAGRADVQAAIVDAEKALESAEAHAGRAADLKREAAERFEAACRKAGVLMHAAAVLGIEGDGVWDAVRIAEELDLRAAKGEAGAVAAGAEILKLQARERSYASGNLAELSGEDEAFVRSLGIERIVYGSRRLAEMQSSAEEKRAILRRHPLLPYALVVSQDEMAKVAAAEEWLSERPVAFILEDHLVAGETASASDGRAGFLLRAAAGAACLDKEAVEARLREIRTGIAEAQARRDRLADDAGKLRSQAREVREAAISKAEHERLRTGAAEAEAEAERTAAQMRAAAGRLKELRGRAESLADRSMELERQSAAAKAELEEFARLDELHVRFLEAKAKIRTLEEDVRGRNAAAEALEERLGLMCQRLEEVRRDLVRTEEAAGACGRRLSDLQDAAAVPVPEGFSVADAEAEVQALDKEIGGDGEAVRDLELQAADLRRIVGEREAELSARMEDCGASAEDVRGEPADREHVRALRRKAGQLEGSLEKSGTRLRDLDGRLGGCKAEADMARAAVADMGMGSPMDASAIDAEGLWTCPFGKEKSHRRLTLGKTVDRERVLDRHEGRLDGLREECLRAGAGTAPEGYERRLPECFDVKELNVSGVADAVRRRIDGRARCAVEFKAEKGRFLSEAERVCKDERYDVLDGIPALFLMGAREAADPEGAAEAFRSFAEQLPGMRAALDSEIFTLGEALRDVEEKEKELAGGLYEYVEKIFDQLDALGRRARIESSGRSVEALSIQLPKWEFCRDAYREKAGAALRRFRDECLNEARAGAMSGEGIGAGGVDADAVGEAARRRITTRGIFSAVAEADKVKFFVLKAGRFDSKPIRWSEAAPASGGQHTLASFIMLCAFLNYMRRDDGDSFLQARRESKVLIMDNPFGRLSSEHLVRPLKAVAEMYGVQLVCFTAHHEQSIDEAFDNHYVIKLVRREGSGSSYVDGRLVKGAPVQELLPVHIEIRDKGKSLLDLI